MSNIVVPILRQPARRAARAGAYIVACVCAMAASAQTVPLCDGLRAITAATSSQYVDLRGSFDSLMDAYRGTLFPGSLTECRTHSDGTSAEYTCELRLPDDAEHAHRSFDTLTAGVKACFGKDVKPMKSSMPDHRAWFRNIVGGESISISYRRHVPKDKSMEPRYMLKMEISTLDLNEKQ